MCSLRACHMCFTRNHMFIREIWGKFTSLIFRNFEISLVSLGRFQNFKKVKSINSSRISLLNMWLLVVITRLIEINIAPLTVWFCNCPLLNDISFNTKCLLVWCDWPVIRCLFRATFEINHSCDFRKFWNCPRFTWAVSTFQKCTQAIYPKSHSQACDY